MRNLTKVLGLVLLAAVAVMAVNASAAQAGFKLLKEGSQVMLISLVFSGSLVKISTGHITIHCTGSTGQIHLNDLLNGIIDIHAAFLFSSCTVTGAGVCTISDVNGAGNKMITGEGDGTVTGMTGEDYFGTVSSKAFAKIFFEGAGCNLSEEEVVSGTIKVTSVNGGVSAVEHELKVTAAGLFLGEEEATLEGGNGKFTEAVNKKPISLALTP